MNTMKLPVGNDVAHYVAAVRAELVDLPPDDLDDLTGGLEADLSELVAESPSGWRGLSSPQEYAAELRSAAGIPPGVKETKAGWWAQQQDLARANVADLVTDYPVVRYVRDLAVELRPAWWVLRGLLLAWMLVVWGSLSFLIYPLAVVGVLLSVHVGRQRSSITGWGRRGVIGANVVALFGVVLALEAMLGLSSPVTNYDEGTPVSGLEWDGQTAMNLYAYDAQGNRLSGVRIFDDHGRPLDLRPRLTTTDGEPLPTVSDADGRSWGNVFPVPSTSGEVDPWTTSPDSPSLWTPPLSLSPLLTVPGLLPTTPPTVPPTGGAPSTSEPSGAATAKPTTSPSQRPTASATAPTGTTTR